MVKKSKIVLSIFIVFLLFINIIGCTSSKESVSYNENVEFENFLTEDLNELFENNFQIMYLLNEIKFNETFIYIDKVDLLIDLINNINIDDYINKLNNISVITYDKERKDSKIYWLKQEKTVFDELKNELNKDEFDYGKLEDLYNQIEDINLQISMAK